MALDLSALDHGFDRADGAQSAGTAARAPIGMFEEDPENPRFENNEGAFGLLVADIKRHGILQPIVVRRTGEGRFRIRFGARRYRAAVQLEMPELLYVVTEDERQFTDYAQVAENEQRVPLQPLELATFIAKKLEKGERKSHVAAELGIDASAVTHLLALVDDAPPFLLELYHARRCRLPVYLYRIRRLWDRARGLVELQCARIAEIDSGFIDALSKEVHRAMNSSLAPADVQARGNGEVGGTAVQYVGLPASAGATVALATVKPDLGDSTVREETDPPDAAQTTPYQSRWVPRLVGDYRGRSVELMIFRRPSKEECVLVRDYSDGEVSEVFLNEVKLYYLKNQGHS